MTNERVIWEIRFAMALILSAVWFSSTSNASIVGGAFWFIMAIVAFAQTWKVK